MGHALRFAPPFLAGWLAALASCTSSSPAPEPANALTPAIPTSPPDGGVPAAPSDPTVRDGGAEAAVDAEAGCNDLPNTALPIATLHRVAASAPAATGGTIADGTYHLIDLLVYVGPSEAATPIPIDLASTIRIRGDRVEHVFEGKSGDGKVIAERLTEALTTSGAKATFTPICPHGAPRTGAFSVGETALSFFRPDDKGQINEWIYAR